MDAISIMLLAIIVILVVFLLTFYLKHPKRNNNELNELIQENQKKIEEIHQEYQFQIDAIEKQHQNIEKQTNAQLQIVTEKLAEIEKLRASELEKAALRIATLEKEINQAIEVGADDVIKTRLAEAKELSLKVDGLENELKLAKESALASENLQSKVNELSKQVNSLEEQLEEAEEEVEEAQKGKKKIQVAYSQLQEELDRAEKEAKHYLQEFNQTKDNLEHLQKEFDIREEALDFVTEVLTAKRTNDESVSMLYKNVDSTVDFIAGELRDCLKSTNNLPTSIENQYFGQALTAWAINKKKTWIQGKVTIAFVGEFSAGKTSIVNRLLSQDNPNVPHLPVSTKATTAIPTYITGGISTFYQFVTPSNELKGISEKTFKRVNKEILEQVKGVSSLIQYFVMTYENPHLEKMSILDTPGFNSNDSEDAERTIEVINECDALFWVFDVNAGTVNRASLKIIKEHLKKPLYIVINQIDTKSKSDVDDVEVLIRKTLTDECINFCDIIRFSKKEPLDIMMNPIHKINRDSARETLLDNLLDYIRNKVKDAKTATKSALQDSNEKEENLDELTNQFKEKLIDLIDDCERAKEIPQYNSRWFSADDYRISQEQFNEFEILLNKIGDEYSLQLNDLFDEQKNVVSELETAWQEHQKAKNQQKKLQDCLDKLEKKNRLFSETKKNTSFSSETISRKKVSQPNTNSFLSEIKSFTVDDILTSAIKRTISNTNEYSEKIMIQVDWNALIKNIKSYFCNSLTNSEIKLHIDDFGDNGFIEEWKFRYNIETFIFEKNASNLIKSCATSTIRDTKNIKEEDVNWDLLIQKAKQYYGANIERWQLINQTTRILTMNDLVNIINQKSESNKKLYPSHIKY